MREEIFCEKIKKISTSWKSREDIVVHDKSIYWTKKEKNEKRNIKDIN